MVGLSKPVVTPKPELTFKDSSRSSRSNNVTNEYKNCSINLRLANRLVEAGVGNSDALKVFERYLATYELKRGEAHPTIKVKQIKRVLENLSGNLTINEDEVDCYFERSIDTDCNINHFVTPSVLRVLEMETR